MLTQITTELPMSTQNYDDHAKMVPMYHYVTFGIVVLTFIGSLVYLWVSWGTDHQHGASLQSATLLGLFFVMFWARIFALRAQDRAIRAEENLRHFVRHGSLIDPALTMRQIIGLRFAPDEEWDALASNAASNGTSEKEIKQSIANWKADEDRV